MMKWIQENRLTFLTLLGTALAIFGCVLIMMGFWVAPVGEIANSVLIAVGEVFTFSGSVLGIAVTYKSNLEKLKQDINNERTDRTNN